MSALKQLGLSILGLSVCCGLSAGEHAHKHDHDHAHESKHKHEHEAEHQHHAHTHEHGVAKVNMAVDNKNVTFEVILAGNDVVGFEHAPKTKAEQEAYEKVMARLKQSDTVLTLPQAAQYAVVSQASEKIQFNSSHGGMTYTYQCQRLKK